MPGGIYSELSRAIGVIYNRYGGAGAACQFLSAQTQIVGTYASSLGEHEAERGGEAAAGDAVPVEKLLQTGQVAPCLLGHDV